MDGIGIGIGIGKKFKSGLLECLKRPYLVLKTSVIY